MTFRRLRSRLLGLTLIPLSAAALASSCKDDSGGGGGSSETGNEAADNSADNTGAPPCNTGLQPHGQCIEQVDFGDQAILQVRVGVFTPDGRESIATQAVQTLSMGRLFAQEDGSLVLQEGPAIVLSPPWEIVVGRFHAGLDVDEILYIEPDFADFHFFRPTSPGFSLQMSEPSNAGAVGESAIAYDVDGDGVDEVYDVSLSGSASILQGSGGTWGVAGDYVYNGGPVGDAGVVFDMDQDGELELVAPLAGNTAGAYDPSTHKFIGYYGTGGMLVVEGQFDAGDKPYWLDAGDFDGDGFDDLLVKGDDVGYLLSSPFGLGAHNSLALQGGVASRARACDINGDGLHEVVTMPQAGGGALLIWSNLGVGEMPEIETGAMVSIPQELECPDLDGDGRDEIVFRDDTALRVLKPISGS